jgi:hypothetical protein
MKVSGDGFGFFFGDKRPSISLTAITTFLAFKNIF